MCSDCLREGSLPRAGARQGRREGKCIGEECYWADQCLMKNCMLGVIRHLQRDHTKPLCLQIVHGWGKRMVSPLAAISHWWTVSPQGYLPYLQGASACMPDGGCSASAAVGGRGESACGLSEVGVVQLYPCTMWGTGEASAARSVSSSGCSSSSETAPLFKDRPKQFLQPLWLVSKASRHSILAAETEDVINITSARNPEPILTFSYTFQFPNSLVSMNPAFLRLFSFPLSHSWFLALILTVSFLEYCKYFPISFPTSTS